MYYGKTLLLPKILLAKMLSFPEILSACARFPFYKAMFL